MSCLKIVFQCNNRLNFMKKLDFINFEIEVGLETYIFQIVTTRPKHYTTLQLMPFE